MFYLPFQDYTKMKFQSGQAFIFDKMLYRWVRWRSSKFISGEEHGLETRSLDPQDGIGARYD
jgi:hypothetical protein